MSVAREHDDRLDLFTAYFVVQDFIRAFLAHLDEPMAGNHDELLPLRVVPMLSFRDARLGNVDAYLTAIQRVYQFGKRPARIHVHLQIENRLFFRLDWEVIGDIVAERGDGRIIVRAAPFSVKVRETVDEYFRTGLLAVFEEKILAGFLAPAVFAVAETSCQ